MFMFHERSTYYKHKYNVLLYLNRRNVRKQYVFYHIEVNFVKCWMNVTNN